MAHVGTKAKILTAREAGLIGCGVCGRVSQIGTEECPRCETELHSRKPDNLQKVWAWLIAGLVAYIPANLYPILRTEFLGKEVSSTILGGVIDLMHHGAFLVGGVVFVASIMIPVSKFLVLGYLAYSIKHRVTLTKATRTHLYEFVEFIGRWSMIDVFVVSILVALVHIGKILVIRPGVASIAFAALVIVTMVAAEGFDPRLIWDKEEEDND